MTSAECAKSCTHQALGPTADPIALMMECMPSTGIITPSPAHTHRPDSSTPRRKRFARISGEGKKRRRNHMKHRRRRLQANTHTHSARLSSRSSQNMMHGACMPSISICEAPASDHHRPDIKYMEESAGHASHTERPLIPYRLRAGDHECKRTVLLSVLRAGVADSQVLTD